MNNNKILSCLILFFLVGVIPVYGEVIFNLRGAIELPSLENYRIYGRMELYQSHLIIGSGENEILLLDVSDPSDIQLIAQERVDDIGNNQLKVFGDALYLMPYNESVNRIDLINFPELGAETTILDIESNSQYKFLNAGNQCLFLDMYGISDDYTVQKVYDNSSPLHPVEVSTDTVLGKIENFEFLGNFTVKTFEYNRVISIKVFDVSDPSSVDLVGFSPVFDRVNITSVIKDGFVYLYHNDDYIRSYDTSDPNNIEVAGRVHFSTFQSTPSLIQLGDYLGAILDSTIGFFDISDQYRPFYLAQIDHQDEIHEAMMNGNLVYIRSANQITIYEMEETSGVSMADGPLVSKTISLVQNYPNPFNGFTNVVIDLKKQSNSVQLLTYDILGRRVETRRLGVLSKGVNTISYSLNRPAGTYFIQIRMGNEVSAMKKIQLVK